jgi:nucleoside-diphosphate-sugar epimerase
MLSVILVPQYYIRSHATIEKYFSRVSAQNLINEATPGENLMDSDLQPEIHNEATNEIRHQYLSAEKARRFLVWKPLFTLDEGLKATIDWYRKFFANE